MTLKQAKTEQVNQGIAQVEDKINQLVYLLYWLSLAGLKKLEGDINE